jgi:hypothetical protein
MKVRFDAEGRPLQWLLTASEAARFSLPKPPPGKGKPGITATLSDRPAKPPARRPAPAAAKYTRPLEWRIEEAKRAISPEPEDDALTLYKIAQAKALLAKARGEA